MAKHFFSRKALQLLLGLGIFVGKSTQIQEAIRTLQRLKPLKFGAPLVRIGPEGDGGYVIPDTFDIFEAVFSPGVATSVDFELNFAERGIPCFAIDGSITAPPKRHRNLHFSSKWLGACEAGEDRVCLEHWASSSGFSKNLLLQMDIEGAEYEVFLDSSSQTLSRFSVIVVEFHDLLSVFSRSGNRLLEAVFSKIGKTHAPVYANLNNVSWPIKIGGMTIPNNLEVTFVLRDQFHVTTEPSSIGRLGQRNVPGRNWEMSWPSYEGTQGNSG